jgi:hypothetical protein
MPAREGAGQTGRAPALPSRFGAEGASPRVIRMACFVETQRPSPRKSGERERRRCAWRLARWVLPHQRPVFFIEIQGSCGGLAAPFCRSSIECMSGERTNAMVPSRGGRLMVTPAFIRRSQVA